MRKEKKVVKESTDKKSKAEMIVEKLREFKKEKGVDYVTEQLKRIKTANPPLFEQVKDVITSSLIVEDVE